MVTRPPKTEATLEDLYEVDGKAEIVNGEIFLMSPTGYEPGYAAFQITMALHLYAKRTGVGRAIPDNVGFVVNLPSRKSFSPDAAYHLGSPTGMRFLEGAPVFAAEVRSEGDYGTQAEREMQEKRQDYFAAGTLVVWDVDLQSPEVVRKYTAQDPLHPTRFGRGQLAEAEPAVPGWSMPVDDLFE